MRLTIIDGYPDPCEVHLNHALAKRYALAAEAAGHEVRRINVAALDFPVLRDPREFTEGHPPEEILGAQRDIVWADHITFFFPLWMSDMLALLKAFLEQTFRPGFALAYGSGRLRFPKPLLKGKSARIVVTMGMPGIVYYGLMGSFMLKMLTRLLRFAGIKPVRHTVIGGVENARDRTRARWFDAMDRLAARDVAGTDNRIAAATRVVAIGGGVAAASYLGSVLKSWARYGETRPDEGHDSLLDRFMPHYEVALRHETLVHAPAELTFAAIRVSDPSVRP